MKLLILALLIPFCANAAEISGSLTQGGFIFGKTEPNSTITINQEAVPVSKEGHFVYGIPRKAAPELTITTKTADQQSAQTLLITPRKYQVQHIKGVQNKHVTPRAPKDLKHIKSDSKQIYTARAIYSATTNYLSQFTLPASGTITGVYGSSRTYNGEERNWHKGLDIAAPTGTPVTAPAPATVSLALPNSFFNGNLIILDHGQQFFTIYAHLDSMNVKKGDKVAQGQLIGKIGTTGRSTGPHLHWGAYWKNRAIDPALLVPSLQTP